MRLFQVIVLALIAVGSYAAELPAAAAARLKEILPEATPDATRKAYADLVADRLAKGLSEPETFDFLSKVIPKTPASVSGGLHPHSFIPMLNGSSGEIPDYDKRYQKARADAMKATGKFDVFQFDLWEAAPILKKYPNWELLREFVVAKSTAPDTKFKDFYAAGSKPKP